MSATASPSLKPLVVRGNDVKPFWLFRDHVTPLLGRAETGNTFGLVVSRHHCGEGSPPHIHRNEDEAFYILEGEVTFLYGEGRVRATAGQFVYGPRDIVHNFTCTGPTPAKMVMLVTPCDFLDFAGEFARPAESFDQPPEMTPEIIGRLLEAAPRYGMEIKLGHEMPVTITDAARPKKRLWVMGEEVRYLATAADTNGQFTAVEVRTAPGGGPPPHAHRREDETFYVIENEHTVTLNGETSTVGPGDTVFVPRGTTHSFTNAHPTRRGRILSFHTPGGFETFFYEVGTPCEADAAPPAEPALSREQISALFGRHGMDA